MPNADELEVLVRAKEANRWLLLARPNVTGLAVGYRLKGGEETEEPVIKVYVAHKVDRSLLNDDQVIPSSVTIDEREVGVDVEESAIAEPATFTLRSRPLRGGSSISSQAARNRFGTGGICVTLNDGNTYILSCNHVIAGSNTFAIGTIIDQPAIADGGTVPNDDVATLFRFAPIDFGTTTITIPGDGVVTVRNPNRVDCAIGRVTGVFPYNVGNREIHWIGYPRRLVSGPFTFFQKLLMFGNPVCKMGRTTDFTLGTVVNPFRDVVVGPYPFVGTNALFINQLQIQGDGGRPFAAGGDSGSVVVRYDTGDPLGLFFAFSGSDGGVTAFANPLDDVLAALAIPQM